MNIEKEVKDLGEVIVTNQSNLSKAEGSVETLMARLKDEENIETVEESESVIQELDIKITDLERDIESKVLSLKEIYKW